MDSKKDYNAIVNPTFETARVASYLLSRSEEDNAVKFVNLLGFTENPFEAAGKEASEGFLNLISTNMETRYKSVNTNLKESGIPNILRLHTARSGRHGHGSRLRRSGRAGCC